MMAPTTAASPTLHLMEWTLRANHQLNAPTSIPYTSSTIAAALHPDVLPDGLHRTQPDAIRGVAGIS
jgi:hypothetical protein